MQGLPEQPTPRLLLRVSDFADIWPDRDLTARAPPRTSARLHRLQALRAVGSRGIVQDVVPRGMVDHADSVSRSASIQSRLGYVWIDCRSTLWVPSRV